MSDQEDVKPERICVTLSDAVLQWADPDLLADFMQAREKGHSFAYIFGKDSAADRLADPYCRAVDSLRGSLIAKLKAEELVAYAFDSRSPTEADRTRIHPGRWRVLTPDFDSDTARGGGLELYDVLVTTPETHTPSTSLVPKLILVLSDNAKTARTHLGHTKLSPKEYKLLRFLAQRAQSGKPLASHDEIFDFLYVSDTPRDNVRTHVYKVRHKLDPLCDGSLGDQSMIENRSRHGYGLRLHPDQVRIE